MYNMSDAFFHTFFLIVWINSSMSGFAWNSKIFQNYKGIAPTPSSWASVATTNSTDDRPIFEETARISFSKVGESVVLPCMVKNLKDNVVSWIRRKDLKILTSGFMMFTADSRFRVEFSEDGCCWSLTLNRVEPDDAGLYECQINTEPKMKRSVTLLVASENGVEDVAYDDDSDGNSKNESGYSALILGSKDQYVRSGSTVTFTCQVGKNDSDDDLHYNTNYKRSVNWFHDTIFLNFQSERGGVSVDTEISSNMILSRLTISDVISRDEGAYTCKPVNGSPFSINLHVVKGENVEAMQDFPPNGADGHYHPAPFTSSISSAFFVFTRIYFRFR